MRALFRKIGVETEWREEGSPERDSRSEVRIRVVLVRTEPSGWGLSGDVEVLALIGKLYEVERLVPGPFPGDEEAQALRLRLRQGRSRPLVNAIREWAMGQRGLPRSDFGKAVRYMLERWDKLTVFVNNPLVSPDNNHAKRAVRGPVVGRKNHYGSRSKRGTEVAALFYTLCETAKLQNIEPRLYLLKAAYAAIEQPGSAILPDALRDDSAT